MKYSERSLLCRQLFVFNFARHHPRPTFKLTHERYASHEDVYAYLHCYFTRRSFAVISPGAEYTRNALCFVSKIFASNFECHSAISPGCVLVTGALADPQRNKIPPRSCCFVKQPRCLSSSIHRCVHMAFYPNSSRHFDLRIEFITSFPPIKLIALRPLRLTS